MAAELVVALATASGAFAVAGVTAGATYWFTKKREREAELRKEKLEHYKDFASALSGVITGESTPDGQRAFARACNRLNLVAPLSVLKALQVFQQEIKVSNAQRNGDRHDQLMSALFLEMRQDLRVAPQDGDDSFVFGLWAAGQPPSAN
jgi:hypothetical protein